jgi:hypothetical protein
MNLARMSGWIVSPLIATSMLSGCGGLGGLAAGPYPGVPELRKEKDYVPTGHDGKPFPNAVLYRFDDQRYLTLERRWYCEQGKIWYNDTEKSIRTLVDGTGKIFQGAYTSSSATTIVVPVFTSSSCSSGAGNVCGMYLLFSLDGGRTFEELNGPWGALKTPNGLAVESNKLFMLWGDGVESIDLAPGKRLSKKGNDFTEEPLAAGDILKRAASPSGQSRLQCENR